MKLWKIELLLQKHRGKEKSVKLRTSWQVDAEGAGRTAGTSEGTQREDQIKNQNVLLPSGELRVVFTVPKSRIKKKKKKKITRFCNKEFIGMLSLSSFSRVAGCSPILKGKSCALTEEMKKER